MSEEIKTKVCPKCGRELTADMFNLSAKSADGLQSYCKECSKKAALESKKRKFTPPPTPYCLTDRSHARSFRKSVSA